MQNWQAVSADPNSAGLMDARRVEIQRARQPQLVSNRIAYLSSLARGRDVLDIGIVEHFLEAANNPNWLHRHIASAASSCLGVDLLPEVEKLAANGFNVRVADLAAAPLDQTFDLIVAGEVLEHIDAPGSFMKNCAAMLRPNGRLALTVPNPWHINAVIKSAARRQTFVDSTDHVGWYDASTLLELGQRSGLQLIKFAGIAGSTPKSAAGKMLFAAQPILIGLGLSPLLFAKSIIYEFGLVLPVTAPDRSAM